VSPPASDRVISRLSWQGSVGDDLPRAMSAEASTSRHVRVEYSRLFAVERSFCIRVFPGHSKWRMVLGLLPAATRQFLAFFVLSKWYETPLHRLCRSSGVYRAVLPCSSRWPVERNCKSTWGTCLLGADNCEYRWLGAVVWVFKAYNTFQVTDVNHTLRRLDSGRL